MLNAKLGRCSSKIFKIVSYRSATNRNGNMFLEFATELANELNHFKYQVLKEK